MRKRQAGLLADEMKQMWLGDMDGRDMDEFGMMMTAVLVIP